MVPSGVITGDVERGCVFWDPIANGPGFVIGEGAATSGVYTADYNVTHSNAYNYVTTGYVRSGLLTYDMQDNKTVCQANLKTAPTNLYSPFDTAGGGVTLDVSYDRGAFAPLAPLAPNTQANPPVLVTPLTAAEEIEVEAILTSTASTHAGRPFLNRWTIKALPNVVSGIYVYVAVQLFASNEMEGVIDFSAVYEDYSYLENLRLSQEVITYQEGYAVNGLDNFTATCVVNELYWMPQQRRDTADGGYEGVLVVTLKSLVG